jgi:hypothetical protein
MLNCYAVGFLRPYAAPKHWSPGLLYVEAPSEDVAASLVRMAHPELLEGWILMPVEIVPKTSRGVPTELISPEGYPPEDAS